MSDTHQAFLLSPDLGDFGFDFLLVDFDEFFVGVDEFLFGFEFGDDFALDFDWRKWDF